MTYNVRPLSCDPKKLKGLSERLIVSHWENNYGGAVKRLNAITTQLAGLDFATAPVFLINGLKREELIATNSMILHELYFDGRARYVRALLPHRLRRGRREIRRRVHGKHQLGERRAPA